MLKVVSSLFKAQLLSPLAIFRMLRAISLHGVNLMAILQFSAWKKPNRLAIDDAERRISYSEMLIESMRMAEILSKDFGLLTGDKTALICRNHIAGVEAVAALSRLGVDCYLISTELSEKQLGDLIEKNPFKLLIADDEQREKLPNSQGVRLVILSELTRNLEEEKAEQKLKKTKSGNIVVLSSGTTGNFKTAKRKASSTNYLSPFIAVLSDLELYKYRSVYIATPIYHGFALAALVISLLLSSKVYFLRYFDADTASDMIFENEIEVASLVPLMLKRMLKNPEKLHSLKCVISGSAPLSPELVYETQEKLGEVLANLYGTSEAGFTIMATPSDLKKEPESIGRAVRGVGLKVVGGSGAGLEPKQTGLLYTKAKWSMSSKQSQWIKTGDLAYINENGYVFLQGREDQMIVSAGENVYPIVLQTALMKHPSILDAKLITVPDEEFGQRLKALVVLKNELELSKKDLRDYLGSQIARFQMPKEIEFVAEIGSEKDVNSDKLV